MFQSGTKEAAMYRRQRNSSDLLIKHSLIATVLAIVLWGTTLGLTYVLLFAIM